MMAYLPSAILSTWADLPVWAVAVVGLAAAVAAIHTGCVTRWAVAWHRAGAGNPRRDAEDGPSPAHPAPAATPTAQDVHNPLPPAPVFTVVIPARNEAPRLGKLLGDLEVARREIFGGFDVVVVDDGSDDGTAEVARTAGVRVLSLSQRDGCIGEGGGSAAGGGGKKAALLSAMAQVSTPWAVTLDADVRLQPGWGAAWHACLGGQPEQVAAVAGPVVLLGADPTASAAPIAPGMPTAPLAAPSGSRWARVQALDFAAQLGWAAGRLAEGWPASASGANFAVRPAHYPDTRHAGPSGDDVLVLQALHAQGFHSVWLHDRHARVWTAGATTLPAWVSQRMRWAGKAKHYAPHARRTALWMASVSAAQVAVVAVGAVGWGLASSGAGTVGAAAAALWIWISGLHIAFARGVARWFGLDARPLDWLLLALTQPLQVPLLLLARTGALQPFNIPSKPRWKGRTFDP